MKLFYFFFSLTCLCLTNCSLPSSSPSHPEAKEAATPELQVTPSNFSAEITGCVYYYSQDEEGFLEGVHLFAEKTGSSNTTDNYLLIIIDGEKMKVPFQGSTDRMKIFQKGDYQLMLETNLSNGSSPTAKGQQEFKAALTIKHKAGAVQVLPDVFGSGGC